MTCQVGVPVARLDLFAYRGDNFSHTLIWKDVDSNPVDVTGYTAKMQIKQTVNSTTTIVELTELDGLVVGGTDGSIQIDMSSTHTDIATESNVYDVEVIAPDSTVTTLVQGDFKVDQDVTR